MSASVRGSVGPESTEDLAFAPFVEAFERDGYVVVPNAISDEALPELREATERLGAESSQRTDLYVQLEAFHERDPIFLQLVDCPRTLPLLVRLLSWNIYVYYAHLDIYPPLRTEDPRYRRILSARHYAWDWHRDLGILFDDLAPGPFPRLTVKAAFFLTDVLDPDSGEFHMLPGSHHSNEIRGGPAEPDERATTVPVAAGSAVLFDTRIVHSRGPNFSPHTRLTLSLSYAYRWLRPQDEPNLDPRVIAALTPVQRQLMGAGDDASYYLPRPEDVPLRDLAPDENRWWERYSPRRSRRLPVPSRDDAGQ